MFVLCLLASLLMWWLSAAGVYAYPQFYAAAPMLLWWVLWRGQGSGRGFRFPGRRRRRSH